MDSPGLGTRPGGLPGLRAECSPRIVAALTGSQTSPLAQTAGPVQPAPAHHPGTTSAGPAAAIPCPGGPDCTLHAAAAGRRGPDCFAGDTLSIRANNSSLSAILHQVAGKSGMQIEGLSGDERVFGTFGPGAPRDVLADLLNGTPYNLVLLGDLGDGAPRELILTPATHAEPAPPPSPR